MKTRNIKNLAYSVIITLFSVVLLNSCDQSEDVPTLETISYEMAPGEIVTVTLDPNKQHELMVFDNIDEQDAYLLEMENKTQELVINKALYNELSHYWDPYEIAILDNNRMVQIGNEVYKSSKEALYVKPVNGNDWELDLYYGESGKVHEEEIKMVYGNVFNAEKLENYQFQSPAAQQEYQELKIEAQNDFATSGRVQTTRSRTYVYGVGGPNEGEPYEFWYRDATSGQGSGRKTAIVQFYYWHTTKKKKGRRVDAGTEVQIKRVSQNDQWVTPGRYSKVGRYHDNGSLDRSEPKVYLRVRTSKATKELSTSSPSYTGSWNLSVTGVKRRHGAHTYHQAGIRLNNSNRTDYLTDRIEINNQ